MAASKQLVYLPALNRDTWLLMTRVEQGACLRDYRTSPPLEDRSYSTDQLTSMLSQDDSFSEKLSSFSRIPHTDEEFWREQIEFRNAESNLTTSIDQRRLQERFKEECLSAMGHETDDALWSVFERWLDRFRQIKDKDQFNHWDDDSAESKINPRTGIGWTSQLLEASRRDGEVRFIPTSNEQTRFSLAAMELGFGISSKNNPFRPGFTDYIKPDGLGLRQTGYFTVLEVKGPQDETSLLGPMLQATCGALAVVAKKDMLRKIALQSGELRPAFHRAEVPIQSRSVGIHILTQANDQGGPREPWTNEVEDACRSVISAFRQLAYIAYSFVTTEQARDLNTLKTNVLITPDGVVL